MVRSRTTAHEDRPVARANMCKQAFGSSSHGGHFACARATAQTECKAHMACIRCRCRCRARHRRHQVCLPQRRHRSTVITPQQCTYQAAGRILVFTPATPVTTCSAAAAGSSCTRAQAHRAPPIHSSAGLHKPLHTPLPGPDTSQNHPHP